MSASQTSVSRLANPSNAGLPNCLSACIPFRKIWDIARGLSMHPGTMHPGNSFEPHKLAPAQHSLSLSGRLISSSHQCVDLLVYLCTKFAALNRRINETRSCKNRPGLLSQVQPLRFSILPIFWLSDQSPMDNGHQEPSWTTANTNDFQGVFKFLCHLRQLIHFHLK